MAATLLWQLNVELEFQRNRERYEFLRWGQKAFDNFRAVPPNVGIVHQVNLEYLAKGVFLREDQAGPVALPDTLVGTDSHTTMINGLGVVGWGVGGIEAEAAMLGQPIYMLMPEVVGFELTGELRPGTTATDLVLTVTEQLRGRRGWQICRVLWQRSFRRCRWRIERRSPTWHQNTEPRWDSSRSMMSLSIICSLTGRTEDEVKLVERYTKEQGLFRLTTDIAHFTKTLTLDLSTVEPSLAGPKRPQDRVALSDMKKSFGTRCEPQSAIRGFALDTTR